MEMKFVNLTQHNVNVGSAEFPPSGIEARRAVTRKEISRVEGIPLYSTTFGEVVNLPQADEGV
jgi:hypothetical protein